MKTLTVRLPEPLVAQIEAESRARRLSKSDVVRERLSAPEAGRTRSRALDCISDLIGSVDAAAPDLSTHKKRHLKAAGYGRKPAR